MEVTMEQVAALNLQKDLRLMRLEEGVQEMAGRIMRLEAALREAGVTDPDQVPERPKAS